MSDTSAADTPAPAAEVVQSPVTSPHRRSRNRRGRSAATMVLQVVLIALGVFLGLAGEEWREDRENRRVAADTLRRFREEITANREAVLAVKDYHTEQLADLNAYFAATTDEEKESATVQLDGILPPALRKDGLGARARDGYVGLPRR